MNRLVLASVSTILIAFSCSGWSQASVQLSPMIVRQSAVASPMPQYPTSSIQSHHQGVAVAEIQISVSGTPSNVSILQAPDEAIANSLATALGAWRFRKYVGDPKVLQLRTRLIFYFTLENNVPNVIDAQRSQF